MESIGIPRDKIKEMIDRDDMARVIMRTPIAHLCMTRRTVDGDDLDTDLMSFAPKRGIGQGTKDSTLLWNIVENVTHRVINGIDSSDDFLIWHANHSLRPAKAVGYSDDLNLISTGARGLEAKLDAATDVVEAFEERVSTHKLKQVITNHGHEGLDQSRVMSVNDGSGTKRDITVPSAAAIKILGFTHYIGCKDENYKELKRLLTHYCCVIGKKRASSAAKTLALNSAIFQRLLYQAQFTDMSLEQCRQLDVPINKLLRKLTKNLPGFPTRLLYMEICEAGLGYRRFSDEIQQRKWNNFVSGMTQDGATKAAYEGLLLRASRLTGLRLLPQQGGDIKKPAAPCWARSLLESIAECGLTLSRGGDRLTGTHNEPTQSVAVFNTGQLDAMARNGVYSMGDLTSVDEAGQCGWVNLTGTALVDLQPLLESRDPPPQDVSPSPRNHAG